MLTELYETVLPVSRDVRLFQKKEQNDSQVFPEQQQLMKTFFAYFIKPEPLVECRTVIQLKDLDFEENSLPKNLILERSGSL